MRDSIKCNLVSLHYAHSRHNNLQSQQIVATRVSFSRIFLSVMIYLVQPHWQVSNQ